MATIKKSIVIRASVSDVTATAFDPYRWHTWFIGLSEPERVEGTGEAGTVVKQYYLLAGIRFPVTTRVVVAERSADMGRWEAVIEGPLSGRNSWTYTPVPNGTEVKIEVEYTVPGAAIGKFVDRLIIERMQERSAEQTLDNLKLLCEAATA